MDDEGGTVIFLDTSALVKLVVNEPDSDTLRRFVNAHSPRYTPSLCFAEALGVLKGKRFHGVAVPCAKGGDLLRRRNSSSQEGPMAEGPTPEKRTCTPGLAATNIYGF